MIPELYYKMIKMECLLFVYFLFPYIKTIKIAYCIFVKNILDSAERTTRYLWVRTDFYYWTISNDPSHVCLVLNSDQDSLLSQSSRTCILWVTAIDLRCQILESMAVESRKNDPRKIVPRKMVPGKMVSVKMVPGKLVLGKMVPGKFVPRKMVPGKLVLGKFFPENSETKIVRWSSNNIVCVCVVESIDKNKKS